jgi:hypothetical protein
MPSTILPEPDATPPTYDPDSHCRTGRGEVSRAGGMRTFTPLGNRCESPTFRWDGKLSEDLRL